MSHHKQCGDLLAVYVAISAEEHRFIADDCRKQILCHWL